MKQLRLKANFIEKNIKMVDIAKILGISYAGLNKKMNGASNFTLEEAFIISYVLDEPIRDIFSHKKFTKKVLDFKKRIS